MIDQDESGQSESKEDSLPSRGAPNILGNTRRRRMQTGDAQAMFRQNPGV